eukprot:3490962-Rhodomonas_salina.2
MLHELVFSGNTELCVWCYENRPRVILILHMVLREQAEASPASKRLFVTHGLAPLLAALPDDTLVSVLYFTPGTTAPSSTVGLLPS